MTPPHRSDRYPCEFCGAPAGEPCVDSCAPPGPNSDWPADPPADRIMSSYEARQVDRAAERVARARKAVTDAKAALSRAIAELDDAEYSAVTDFGLDLDRIRRLGGRWKDTSR